MTQGATDLLRDRFQEIKEDITPDDKAAAKEQLKISHVTIHRYIKGDIGDLEKAIVLFDFLFGRIKERVDRIKSIA